MAQYRVAAVQLLIDSTGRPVGFKEVDGDEIYFATLNAAQDGFLKPDGSALSVGGGGSAITVNDEGGAALTAALASMNFVGSGVTATNVGDDITVTVPGATFTASSVDTVTNKRITSRTAAVGSSATPMSAVSTDSYDRVNITGLAVAITSMTPSGGAPAEGDKLEICITDNGTGRAIAWGTSYEASTIALPTTTVASAKLSVYFDYNSTTSKWRCVGYA